MTFSFVLRYNPHDAPDTQVPWELRNFYSQDIWARRIDAVTRKASRYYKKRLEFCWFLGLLACSIAVPIAMYYVAISKLPLTEEEKKQDNEFGWHWFHGGFDRWWKARLIGLASWFAVLILFYVPILVWKDMGRKDVNKLFQKWEKEDHASRTGHSDMPSLKLMRIGVFGSMIKIRVRLPAGHIPQPPSSFHPGAQLPAYLVNPPADTTASSYYYGNSGPMSAPIYPQSNFTAYPVATRTALSGVPLYNANDEKADFVSIPVPERKSQHFDEVKV